MSDHSTIPMPKCTYCSNFHNYSVEMCRDMHKIHAQPGMFSEVTICAPCNECEYRKAAALRADGWVSVEERLPADGERVLATDHGHVYTATLSTDGVFSDWWCDSDNETHPTHWMPLPPAPEETP